MFGEERDIYTVSDYLPTDVLLHTKGKSKVMMRKLIGTSF